MTDRELLEKAAKAAELAAYWDADQDCMVMDYHHKGGTNYEEWNPLNDDGDALRLAVKLNLLLFTARGIATANASDRDGPCIREIFVDDANDLAATRRAIVRAAAALGEQGK